MVKNNLSGLSQDKLDISIKKRTNLFPWKGQFSPQLVEELLKECGVTSSFVLDPFVGSGTVLYESGRLGLQAYGSDLNPASVILSSFYTLINTEYSERKELIREVGSLIYRKESSDNPKAVIIKNLFELLSGNMTWDNMKDLLLMLPFSSKPIFVKLEDARRLSLASQVIDLVVTSPPYINVFNYHQQYRPQIEKMGWDILSIARSEIGSNRKHRQNRFLTVIQYCLDMELVFHEIGRVCKDDAFVVFVIGRESNVCKTPFYNSFLLKTLAVESGLLKLQLEQTRQFTNRYGNPILEDILYFTKSRQSIKSVARQVAKNVLEQAKTFDANNARIQQIDKAIDAISEVKPSPVWSKPYGK
jgi:hypothetical protein